MYYKKLNVYKNIHSNNGTYLTFRDKHPLKKLTMDKILHKFNISSGINININIIRLSTANVIENILDNDISNIYIWLFILRLFKIYGFYNS